MQNLDDNIENLLNSQHQSGKTVEEVRLELVSKVGENVKIRRIQAIDANNSYIGNYMHGTKIGVVVLLKNENVLPFDENKINDVSARVNKWWVDYKKKLKNSISKIMHV